LVVRVSSFVVRHCFSVVEHKWNYSAWITGDPFPIKVLLILNCLITARNLTATLLVLSLYQKEIHHCVDHT
jgi:hypothetical protein